MQNSFKSVTYKLIFVGKIFVGTAIVIFAAMSLRFFEDWRGLAVGSALMLIGVLCAYILESRNKKCLILIGITLITITISADFFPNFMWSFLQYFVGGFLVYSGCAIFRVSSKR